MDNAASREFNDENKSSNPPAIIIAMIQPGKGRSKQKLKKDKLATPGNTSDPLPSFTNPVFNPKKHDML